MKLFERYVKIIQTSWLLLWYWADDETEIPSVLVKTEVYFGLGVTVNYSGITVGSAVLRWHLFNEHWMHILVYS